MRLVPAYISILGRPCILYQYSRCCIEVTGDVVPPAEAVADAVYMVQSAEKCFRMLHPEVAQKPAQNRVVLCLVSEPSRISVPWPYPADCKTVAGKASHAELCQVTILKPMQASLWTEMLLHHALSDVLGSKLCRAISAQESWSETSLHHVFIDVCSLRSMLCRAVPARKSCGTYIRVFSPDIKGVLVEQALRSHGADFSFAAGHVQGNKMLHTRLIRTFALAHVRQPSNPADCACFVQPCHVTA